MIGVIGGSGFYELMTDGEDVLVDTPYGSPSAPVTVGTIAGRRVAFLPRHGREHQFVAHRVPYRANIWALHHVGVRSLIAPCSVGSLQADLHPGQMVVVDQVVDMTRGRATTFHDVGAPSEEPACAAGAPPDVADPYDAGLRTLLLDALAGARRHRRRGMMVVIEGPRFSTRRAGGTARWVGTW
jgi:5'-methylthioadenosine phosphorylase